MIGGFPHGGRRSRLKQFTGWKLLDLSRFKIRLKPELQGAARDHRHKAAIVGKSEWPFGRSGG